MSSSQEQYKKLQNDIRNHDHAYYILDDPEISDGDYDALFQNLLKIETDNPEWITPESPSQRVGTKPCLLYTSPSPRD